MLWPFKKKSDDHDYDAEATNLGNVLLEMGLLTESQLLNALTTQTHEPKRKLGDILVQKGLLTQGELEKALDVQEKLRGGRESAANLAIARCRIERGRTKTQELDAVSVKLAAVGSGGR